MTGQAKIEQAETEVASSAELWSDLDLDAVGMAECIAAGRVAPGELVERALARAQRMNPALNAIIRFVDPPIPADGSKTRVLGGVPFLLKDAFASLAGHATTNGTALLADTIHDRHSVLVQRLIDAGLVILGKTNCPEFNSLGTTEPTAFGATRNPWDLRYSTGGSSGGSAAAVAARIVPAAHASDGAGSIRIPASCCGLVGLKPSRGRITLAPTLGESINGGMSEGFVSVSVRDTAALLDAVAGPAPGDPYFAPPPALTFLEQASRLDRRLRIAATTTSIIRTPTHEECIEAARSAIALCRRLGHDVVAANPPIDGERYNLTYRRIWPVSVARSVRRLEQRLGREAVRAAIEPFNLHLCEIADGLGAVDLALALEHMQATTRTLVGWMDELGVDLWLTPTLGLPPTPLGFFDAAVHGGAEVFDRFIRQVAFTTFANMTGQPAISLPLHWSSEGLPVGVQLQARYGEEGLLLGLATELERACPWASRLPPFLTQILAQANADADR